MRAVCATVLTLSLALTALAATVPAIQPNPPPYRVIVHPDNPLTAVEQPFLRDAFLRKATRWPNDTVIYPVDQRPGSAARSRFTEELLRRSVGAVKAYWQQQIFSGRDVPPPEFAGDDQVVAYVRKHPGAIGYISGTFPLAGVRIVHVRP